MRLIDSIEIKFFRSIYHIRLKSMEDVTILSGRNDVGKSNLLKALNLFFNGQTDWQRSLDFNQDFNVRRQAEVRRETIKGRQFISVKVTFNRGNRFVNSLPERFSVTRTWYRDGRMEQDDNLERSIANEEIRLYHAKRSLTQFLNRISYIYIPAIKDQSVFDSIFSRLQTFLHEIGARRSPDILKNVEETIADELVGVANQFSTGTGIATEVSIAKTLKDLFRVSILTSGPFGEPRISLHLRGDGVRLRSIPSILHYLATKSTQNVFIWGFEEPENSLEYELCVQLADNCLDEYSKASQIIISTHSAAFISLGAKPGATLYRITYGEEKGTEFNKADEGLEQQGNLQLLHELGITRLNRKLHEFYVREKHEFEDEIERLKDVLKERNLPTILVEGKWDRKIIEEAWKKLNPNIDQPFKIFSAEDQTSPTGGATKLENQVKLLADYMFEGRIIAVFDRDEQGVRGWEKVASLSQFQRHKDLPDVVVHRNRKIAAMILPVPPGREQYAEYGVLTLEHYFPDEALRRQTDAGKGLVLKPVEIEHRVGSKVLKTEYANGVIRIVGGKKEFAEEIVPHLSEEQFVLFQELFRPLERVLLYLESSQSSPVQDVKVS